MDLTIDQFWARTSSEMTCISLLPLEILRIWIKSCKQKPSALDTFSRSWPLYHYAYIFHSVYRFLTLWSQPSAYLRRSIIDAATTQSQENWLPDLSSVCMETLSQWPKLDPGNAVSPKEACPKMLERTLTGELKRMQILLSMTQGRARQNSKAWAGRTSPNHVQAF